MTAREILAELQSQANPVNVAGMARFGICSNGTLGVSVAEIRKLAKRAGRSHDLAIELWASGIHEARILATIVELPECLTCRQMDAWARDFDSWDVCDHACQNLFWRSPHAWDMARKWSRTRGEFVRRAGFSLLASLARRGPDIPARQWAEALAMIEEAATDDRNYVRKAVNWALREIGKRNSDMRRRHRYCEEVEADGLARRPLDRIGRAPRAAIMMRRILLLLLIAISVSAQTRQVAITIDDLPRGGGDPGSRDLASIRAMTQKLLAPLRGIPVIGFVNAGRVSQLGDAGLQEILRIWLAHGATLGNHSYSHPDFNDTPLDRYTDDILRGEPAIEKALGKRPLYFRHPFLHTGPDAEKREGLTRFLAEHGYVVAPVTLDDSDWMFAAIYGDALRRKDAALALKVKQAYVPYMESVVAFFEARSKEVVGREIAQTLLIHASQLNADSMPDLLAMFRRRGYRFVSLEDALRDDAYQLKENYTGKGGFSWIHRWSRYLGMPNKGEPNEPRWIAEEYKKLAR